MATEKQNPEKQDTRPLTGLELMREPFEKHQISKLPKPTKHQTEALKRDKSLGIRCNLCGQWHHKDVVHLDYVGHAALTDRLLDCDPEWNWEPAYPDENGRPVLDRNGGLWIKLTVCGVTRLGYGDAPGKQGGNAIKEVIGDALRNAAMRFGAALDLWHKGDLHVSEDLEPEDQDKPQNNQDLTDERTQDPPDFETSPADRRDGMKAAIHSKKTVADLDALFANAAFKMDYKQLPEPMQNEIRATRREHSETIEQPQQNDVPDEIPYG